MIRSFQVFIGRPVVLARDQGAYTPEEIAATVYPDFSLAQVSSALAYFEDHRAVIVNAAHSPDSPLIGYCRRAGGQQK